MPSRIRYTFGEEEEHVLPEQSQPNSKTRRFLELHGPASSLLARLVEVYDAQSVSDGDQADVVPPAPGPDMLTLVTPIEPASATIRVTFLNDSGLLLAGGARLCLAFPMCACDACGASPEYEWERFRAAVNSIVSGKFWERVSLPILGSAHYEFVLGNIDDPLGIDSQRQLISRDEARALRSAVPRDSRWLEWTPRV